MRVGSAILGTSGMGCSYHGNLKIVSGGQTGVDRVALDVAIDLALEHGGWCPRGRLAEDGVIADRYRLRETESAVYWERTHRNVLDSDATLIFAEEAPLSGGTGLTAELAKGEGKPLLVVISDVPVGEASRRIREFLDEESVRILNVAGPRAGGGSVSLLSYVRTVLKEVVRDPAAGDL